MNKEQETNNFKETDKSTLFGFGEKKYNLMSLWGRIILGCGIVATLISLNLDTNNPGVFVYNVGLLNNKTNAVIISQTVILSGVMLLGFGLSQKKSTK